MQKSSSHAGLWSAVISELTGGICYNNFSVRTDDIPPIDMTFVPRLVTFTAETYKVIEVKRHLWSVNVPRIQLLDVMHLDARSIHATLHAVLT